MLPWYEQGGIFLYKLPARRSACLMEKMLKFLARQRQNRILPQLSGPNGIDARNCFSRGAVLNNFFIIKTLYS